MRVIAGSARSIQLKTPKGQDTRPTTDRIKETLFNIIQGEIPGSIFLDLFAGSGGIGIEALSRGAKHAYFVDSGREPSACIAENLTVTKFTDRATLLKQDVFTALGSIHEKEADLIFMDPPYTAGVERDLLKALNSRPYVTENTLLIMEALADADFSFAPEAGFSIVREKKYKTNKHVFFKKIAKDRQN
ncbi:MAG: 16S rRNA (guanine(966)-N(2))-methyltransferase RsmD [Lachnospiraceae bacterium]|nr:16S rRNA (guanine(966)-N(2))-methyltransferase RsmD [Lachnospiraceae bacterium]